jgi:transcription elongation factor Elf1
MSDHADRSRKLARERYWEANDKKTYTCPDCGRAEDEIVGTFHVHHMSETPYDNRLGELVGLCGFCHRLREDKKPSLERIKSYRRSQEARDSEGAQPHPAIADFINRHLCICSEGSGYEWVDVLDVWFDFLEKKLSEAGISCTDETKSEFMYWIQQIETPDGVTDITVEWREGSIVVIGPAPYTTPCDCVTADDIITPGQGVPQ